MKFKKMSHRFFLIVVFFCLSIFRVCAGGESSKVAVPDTTIRYVSVAFVGDTLSGKTTILSAIEGAVKSKNEQTKDVEVLQKQIKGTNVVATYYDTPGAENYFEKVLDVLSSDNMHYVFLVFDVVKSLNSETKNYINKIISKIYEKLIKIKNDGNCVAIIANKSDLKYNSAVNYSENITFLKNVAGSFDWPLIITSAVKNSAERSNYYNGQVICNGTIPYVIESYITKTYKIEELPTIYRRTNFFKTA